MQVVPIRWRKEQVAIPPEVLPSEQWTENLSRQLAAGATKDTGKMSSPCNDTENVGTDAGKVEGGLLVSIL